jgi:hypothetical protein
MIYHATTIEGADVWIWNDGQTKRRFATKAEAIAAEGIANRMAREQTFVSEVRELNRQIWEAQMRLRGLQTEWNALDYSNTLDDGEGENAGITRAMIGAVLFDTSNAIQAVLDAGHATNMAKLL